MQGGIIIQDDGRDPAIFVVFQNGIRNLARDKNAGDFDAAAIFFLNSFFHDIGRRILIDKEDIQAGIYAFAF